LEEVLQAEALADLGMDGINEGPLPSKLNKVENDVFFYLSANEKTPFGLFK
jgi:hypothetical protein